MNNKIYRKIATKYISYKTKYLNFKEKYNRKNWNTYDIYQGNDNKNVAIVIVNYNTMELIALLLFSIYRNLGVENISKIVIIDNNSTDGSKELLKKLEDNNLISFINNKKQKYHGPALNQGIVYLLNHKKRIKKPFRYILILDSDVIILKNEILNDAVSFMKSQNAAVVGQFQYDYSETGDPHVSSILIDPSKVWNRKIHPFTNNGMPTIKLYNEIRKNELRICDFPFRSKNYLLHLGESTLNQIYINDIRNNQYFSWASNYHNHHFHGNKKGAEILQEIRTLFIAEVGEITTDNLVNVLLLKKNLSKQFNEIIENQFDK